MRWELKIRWTSRTTGSVTDGVSIFHKGRAHRRRRPDGNFDAGLEGPTKPGHSPGASPRSVAGVNGEPQSGQNEAV
ncbi:hypothetical protein ACFPK5_22060 [Streptomyces beijiangensis]|uniref:hypothetical protein n=1 Tax=Streptomyces beijiangensis TaxID=163361 RepID=UPI0036153E07